MFNIFHKLHLDISCRNQLTRPVPRYYRTTWITKIFAYSSSSLISSIIKQNNHINVAYIFNHSWVCLKKYFFQILFKKSFFFSKHFFHRQRRALQLVYYLGTLYARGIILPWNTVSQGNNITLEHCMTGE